MRLPREPAYRTETRLSAAAEFEPVTAEARWKTRTPRDSNLRIPTGEQQKEGNRKEVMNGRKSHFIEMFRMALEGEDIDSKYSRRVYVRM
jgi:hypothetical protein